VDIRQQIGRTWKSLLPIGDQAIGAVLNVLAGRERGTTEECIKDVVMSRGESGMLVRSKNPLAASQRRQAIPGVDSGMPRIFAMVGPIALGLNRVVAILESAWPESRKLVHQK
jgi:hypothetical protein